MSCGSYGVRRGQCLRLGCCWRPGLPDTPWCYHPLADNEVSSEPSSGAEDAQLPGVSGCGIPAIMPSVSVRVVGGVEAVPHSWPWQVSLQGDGSHFCGGSLINHEWVLSAAHCKAGFDRSSRHEVVLGLHNRRSPELTSQRVQVTHIIANAKYGRIGRESSNDVMLLKLAHPVTFTPHISPVCLPHQFQPLAPGRRCFSTGWGALASGGGSPDKLMQVMLPAIDNDVCNQETWYNGEIDDSMICAGYEQGGRDTCQGDSGGPFVCYEEDRWMLYGAVSWGYGCAHAMKPGLYARVSPYINWMNQHISANS